MKKNRILTIIWGILFLTVLAFIITNSLKNGEESLDQSSVFVEVFQSTFDPGGTLTKEEATLIVRKDAHFTEFFGLGITAAMFFFHLGKEIDKRNYVLPFFVCLFVASTDEFIQNFTGRTSSGVDVMIDFAGSALAIIIVMVIIFVIEKNLEKKKNKQDLQ